MFGGQPMFRPGDRHQFAAFAMPTKKVSAASLPTLELTEADNVALRELANDLEREVVDIYEEFLFAHARQIDSLRWKHVKTHQDLRVYCERDVNMRSINRLQPFFPSGRQRARTAMGPQEMLAEDTRVPIKMVSGTVAGSLDDAMYGGAIHDSASLRIRGKYQREALQDCAVLNVIDEATDYDPYRFLGVVWYFKSLGIPGISDRDTLLLSQTRLSELSTGERIGVHLYHSIEHEDLPELKQYSVLRMHLSLAIIFRQMDDRCVDVFMLEVLDAKGNTPHIINLQEAAKTLVASANSCATGVKKKLHWCMREKQRKRSLSRLSPLDMDDSTRDTCNVCNKSCTGFFSGSSSLCQLCRKLTCSKCTITQPIIMAATETETETKSFGFCRVCFLDVKNRSTLQIARADMYERRMVRDRALSDRPASDSGTSSSTSR